MTIPEPPPLPTNAVVLDHALRRGSYVAVGAHTVGQFAARWHVWHASGEYIGYSTAAELVPLVIEQYKNRRREAEGR